MLEQLIRNSTQEGETVLDFCMGTGSCGEAAMRLGRRFVGVEIDVERHKDASYRLRELWLRKEVAAHAPSTEGIKAVLDPFMRTGTATGLEENPELLPTNKEKCAPGSATRNAPILEIIEASEAA
ncbi:MAG: hypothetical protein HOJ57_13765 [Lentisphaerae bacterium]|nr:hypothetical protein [Lentisphaerota bacterium]MBT5607003.1 hypothetical protein [Lentisphaerota bacterium]